MRTIMKLWYVRVIPAIISERNKIMISVESWTFHKHLAKLKMLVFKKWNRNNRIQIDAR
jgi:hypothetical protein